MDFLSTGAGKLKLVTVVFGAVTTGLAAAGYYSTLTKETFFLAVVIIALILSVVLVVACFLELNDAGFWKALDVSYHILMGVLLGIGSILFLVSVIEVARNWGAAVKVAGNILKQVPGVKVPDGGLPTKDPYLPTRIAAVVFGCANTLLYFVIAFLVCSAKPSPR